jgi:3-dehydroquinate synthase
MGRRIHPHGRVQTFSLACSRNNRRIERPCSANLDLGPSSFCLRDGDQLVCPGRITKAGSPCPSRHFVPVFLPSACLVRVDPLASDRPDSTDLDQPDRAPCRVDCLSLDPRDEKLPDRCHRRWRISFIGGYLRSGCGGRFLLPSRLGRAVPVLRITCPFVAKEVCGDLNLRSYSGFMPSTYSTIRKNIRLDCTHRVFFTKDSFSMANDTLAEILQPHREGIRTKALVYLDEGILDGNPNLPERIESYFRSREERLNLVTSPIFIKGGEAAKNDWSLVESIWTDLNEHAMCRHSYVIIVGGGAALDLVGFAASTAHRGVRLIRFPTTTLSQGDGGVGVKNGVNFFGKKNWVGTFSIPDAVVNDFNFLRGLPESQKRAGYVEAVKVALIRDRSFFEQMEERAQELARFDENALEQVIRKSAALHLDHIAGSGDPFEKGSARPLDFGHWVAHKIEQLSDFRIGHGDAVAIGLAVDLTYSARIGLIKTKTAERSLRLLEKLGFHLYDELLHAEGMSGNRSILEGLEEFREHLGGELTITLVQGIGEGVEVHAMDKKEILESVEDLHRRHQSLQKA